ncbi:MAG: hypothetical protein ACRCYR_03615 [Phycicoccus sp.]
MTAPNDETTDTATDAAIEAVRAAVQRVKDAESAVHAAIDARVRAVQEHEPALRALGWNRVARTVGHVSPATLRMDTNRRVHGKDN